MEPMTIDDVRKRLLALHDRLTPFAVIPDKNEVLVELRELAAGLDAIEKANQALLEKITSTINEAAATLAGGSKTVIE